MRLLAEGCRKYLGAQAAEVLEGRDPGAWINRLASEMGARLASADRSTVSAQDLAVLALLMSSLDRPSEDPAPEDPSTNEADTIQVSCATQAQAVPPAEQERPDIGKGQEGFRQAV